MWTNRDILRTAIAIIVSLTGWGVFRLLFPALDYFTPDFLTNQFERSWIVLHEVRKPAGLVYLTLALILLAVFFNAIQQHWPGKGGIKGLIFGIWFGGVWSFGFLTGWAFLETTLRSEIINIVVDIIPLAIAGWLIGLAVGRDIPKSEIWMWKPWLAVLLVAFGFIVVHSLGGMLLAGVFGKTAVFLLIPTTIEQIILLFTLGLWVGGMYIMLRRWLPFNKTRVRVAFFAFGIFGMCWTWFNLFFVIEFTGVIPVLLLLGLIGALGVFAGALVYEEFAGQDLV
ncbi:MAG: hypothetical protein OER83_00465 [Flavobacteriaceae bacterium]|nr:hypothetical protein [Flavobacteriaceae bacterium]MDH3795321.1 hypothetical protein [Flavobacteriaceae bacterium]